MGSGMRILVVDDEPVLLKITCKGLRSVGYGIAEAALRQTAMSHPGDLTEAAEIEVKLSGGVRLARPRCSTGVAVSASCA